MVGVQAGQHQVVCRLTARYSRSESHAQAPWTLWPPTPQKKGMLLASPEGQRGAAEVWWRGGRGGGKGGVGVWEGKGGELRERRDEKVLTQFGQHHGLRLMIARCLPCGITAQTLPAVEVVRLIGLH